MRGLYGRKSFDMTLKDREGRLLGVHDVKVRVRACGLCGTDIHYLRDCGDYQPMGHEIAGEIVETGSAVVRVKSGQRVVVEDLTMCGVCSDCKAGNPYLCRNAYSLEGQPGMSDILIVNENMVDPFEGLDFVTASMTEPLAVAVGGIRLARIPAAGSLLIFGMGSIGLLLAAYAKATGVHDVVMADYRRGTLHAESCERVAAAYGVSDIYYTREDGYLDAMLSRHGYFDSSIVAAPPPMAADAIRSIKYGGRVISLGVTFGADTGAYIDINHMIFNKKSLIATIAEPALNFPVALKLIKTGMVDAGKIITNTVTMNDYAKLEYLYGQDAPAIKTVLVND
jgi:threonine dehydrogenase-like Zn-dependent dehydrogenase